jgi:hypothetical protein
MSSCTQGQPGGEATTRSAGEVHHDLVQIRRSPTVHQRFRGEVDAGVDVQRNVQLDALCAQGVELGIVDAQLVLEALQVEPPPSQLANRML